MTPPGEAKIADIGLTGASPSNVVFVKGEANRKLNNDELVDELESMIRAKVAEKEAQAEQDDNIIAKA